MRLLLGKIGRLALVQMLLLNPISAQKMNLVQSQVWNLSDSLSEISGICNAFPVIGSNWLLGIQDGGNSSDMVVFDWENRKSFIVPTGLNNRDWEAITRDNDRVYIGDFGNNKGDRRDLKIYRISNIDSAVFTEDWMCNVNGTNKQGIWNTLLVDSIEFSFEDQQDFRSRFRHNFDCESMLVQGDSIWLFTKNWKNFKSNVYLIKNIQGKQVARFVATINCRSLITDACWQKDKAVLIGYSLLGRQRVLLLDNTNWKVKDRIVLPLKPAQIEGVLYDDVHRSIIIATEKRKSQNAAIFEWYLFPR